MDTVPFSISLGKHPLNKVDMAPFPIGGFVWLGKHSLNKLDMVPFCALGLMSHLEMAIIKSLKFSHSDQSYFHFQWLNGKGQNYDLGDVCPG